MQLFFLQITSFFMEQLDVVFDEVEEMSWCYRHHTMTPLLFGVVQLQYAQYETQKNVDKIIPSLIPSRPHRLKKWKTKSSGIKNIYKFSKTQKTNLESISKVKSEKTIT